MPDWTLVRREHVLAALNEYDRIGGDHFLREYGFGASRGYTLRHEGKSYESKAVLGAAHRQATGHAPKSGAFSGGKAGAAKILRALGFEVTQPDEDSVPQRQKIDASPNTCPTCHLELPGSGICDNCS